jgi:hypothetical protein
LIPTEYDHLTHTIRPTEAEGDDFYGLSKGTNGTAAQARRECVAPAGIRVTWLRFDGSRAAFRNYQPASGEGRFVNPWG